MSQDSTTGVEPLRTTMRTPAEIRITEAAGAVRRAEAVLERMMSAVEISDRADKKMIGDALRLAFDALAVARSNLDALQPAP